MVCGRRPQGRRQVILSVAAVCSRAGATPGFGLSAVIGALPGSSYGNWAGESESAPNLHICNTQGIEELRLLQGDRERSLKYFLSVRPWAAGNVARDRVVHIADYRRARARR